MLRAQKCTEIVRTCRFVYLKALARGVQKAILYSQTEFEPAIQGDKKPGFQGSAIELAVYKIANITMQMELVRVH